MWTKLRSYQLLLASLCLFFSLTTSKQTVPPLTSVHTEVKVKSDKYVCVLNTRPSYEPMKVMIMLL